MNIFRVIKELFNKNELLELPSGDVDTLNAKVIHTFGEFLARDLNLRNKQVTEITFFFENCDNPMQEERFLFLRQVFLANSKSIDAFLDLSSLQKNIIATCYHFMYVETAHYMVNTSKDIVSNEEVRTKCYQTIGNMFKNIVNSSADFQLAYNLLVNNSNVSYNDFSNNSKNNMAKKILAKAICKQELYYPCSMLENIKEVAVNDVLENDSLLDTLVNEISRRRKLELNTA